MLRESPEGTEPVWHYQQLYENETEVDRRLDTEKVKYVPIAHQTLAKDVDILKKHVADNHKRNWDSTGYCHPLYLEGQQYPPPKNTQPGPPDVYLPPELPPLL